MPESDSSANAFVASLSELDILLKNLKVSRDINCDEQDDDDEQSNYDQNLTKSLASIDNLIKSLTEVESLKRTEYIDWNTHYIKTDDQCLIEIENLMESLSDPQYFDLSNDPTNNNDDSFNESESVQQSATCTTCDKLLQPGAVFEYEGKIYCKQDLVTNYNPNCSACNQPILNRMISVFGQNWHPEHFTCSICGSDFDADGFHLSLDGTNRVYCRQCFLKSVAPKCNRCNEIISESYVVALKACWHPHCFTCTICNSTFEDGYFYEWSNKPFCEIHYYQNKGLICYKCDQPINGRCINALSKKYHPEHFLCSFCLKQLCRNTFREAFDRPYCIDCHFKLFGI